MKVKENSLVMKYLNEFFYYSMAEGIFDSSSVMEHYMQIQDMNLEVDDSLRGDARVEGNTLKINWRCTFKDEKYASLVLFHEFAHLCSDLHKDILKQNGVMRIYRDMMERKFQTDYQFDNRRTRAGDANNPYTYFLFGALLLDEVTSENTAENLVAKKFNVPRKPLREVQRKIGNHYVSYRANIDYYSIGQGLADSFAKTLILPKSEKNLNGLSKAVLKKGFTRELIRQHYENGYTLSALYEKLSYLGTICFYEEQSQGHYGDRERVNPQLVYTSFERAKSIMAKGYEQRETIPNNITMPDFYG